MKRRSYERWCGRATTLASPASMLFGGGSNRRSGVVLQLVLWLVSELYTCCFSLVLCGVWLYSILLLKISVLALICPRSFQFNEIQVGIPP